jgi:predicted nucleic acid-binding protein
MSKTVYIESSVISYLTARPSRNLIIAGHQASTAEWWQEYLEQYEAYISPLVIEEISAGDPEAAADRLRANERIPSLSISEEAQVIAEALLSSKAVPANSSRDALHIAIAATQGIDYLLTWNFKHINNASTRTLVINTISNFDLVCAVLCSPEELMGEDNAK